MLSEITDDDIRRLEAKLTSVEKFGEDYERLLEILATIYMERGDNLAVARIMELVDEHNRHELATTACTTPDDYLERARYFHVVGDVEKARAHFMELFAMTLTPSVRVEACQAYARFLADQNDHVQAGEYFTLAADTCDDPGRRAGMLVDAGRSFFIGGDYDRSLATFRSVLRGAGASGQGGATMCDALRGMADAFSGKRDYLSAAVACRSLMQELQTLGMADGKEYAEACLKLATAEKFDGDYQESVADYDRAIAMFERLGMVGEREQAAAGKNLCLFYAGRPAEAIADDRQARSFREEKLGRIISDELNLLEQSAGSQGALFDARACATIAGASATLGNFTTAVDYYRRYLEAIRPALARDFMTKNARERSLLWSQELATINEMSRLATMVDPADDRLAGEVADLLFEGQLLAKGILLTSEAEFGRILDRCGSEQMRADYATIRDNLKEIDDMRSRRCPPEEIAALERATDALQLELARASAQLADFTAYLRTTMADVRDGLHEGEVAVEFVTLRAGVLPDQALVAAVAVRAGSEHALTMTLTSVGRLKAIAADSQRFDREDYAAIIWRPLLKMLPGVRRIYFAPDGLLHGIAIEYLSFDGRPVSETVELLRLSSTREIVRRRDNVPGRVAALFGDVDFTPHGLANLPDSGREIREIGNLLGPTPAETLLFAGPRASRAQFLSVDRRPVGLLHMAVHGRSEVSATEADSMKGSILAFAGGEIVNAAEIAAMNLHDCALAVVSACESGLGRIGADGVYGLQRGLKNAGVATLLVSLDVVADDATADLMTAFYRHLLTEPSPGIRRALQLAQADLRAARPGDPTWAAFILIDAPTAISIGY